MADINGKTKDEEIGLYKSEAKMQEEMTLAEKFIYERRLRNGLKNEIIESLQREKRKEDLREYERIHRKLKHRLKQILFGRN